MASFIDINEIVEDACHAADDYLLRNKMRFLKLAKRVYNEELKMGSIKIPKRQFFKINKYNNTIDLPCDFERLSGVFYLDHNGYLQPMFRNDKLNDDIPDIAAIKNCECGCSNSLCNLIKGYESVVETVTVPAPSFATETFECVSLKGVDGNGWYYETKQYPIQIFEEGLWVRNELKTEKIELCQLEVNSQGCVVDCEENIEKVYSCGSKSNYLPDGVSIIRCSSKMDVFMVECGVGYGKDFKNIYNITEQGDRLIFPSDLPLDKVLIRFYTSQSLQDIKVPTIARAAMIAGILYENVRYRTDRESLMIAPMLGRRFATQQFMLLEALNPITAAQKNNIMTPRAYFP